ncbi:MAG: hypothetical protein COT84_05395 [Chlamydiae bacterium CG10_big_fil_rev_8_21_14_0_10_35_9]|nr:MAG: hypothetical protein COT84_05395 [Chlamydiae bacterium CG10_big_fil_rev_8_21_14_0_10_35_9]
MRVVFLQIKDNRLKVQKLIQIAHYHFQKNEPFLFIANDIKSANYVDELLWKIPALSFLPHVIEDKLSQEKVIITTRKENLNQAKYVFNLCPTPLLWDNLKILYEFEDLTHPGKQLLSRKKYEAYKERKYFIESNLT